MPRPSFLRALTAVQLTSGVVFSSFLLVHLVSPAVVALTGNESAGHGFMILGRVYYQGGFTEPLIIYGSLSAHLLSSLLLRLIYPSTLASPKSPHSVSGFALIPFLTAHLLTHRLIPSSTTNPIINALSPSELDLSFVSYSLDRYPVSSLLAYAGLTFFGVWHAIGGLAISGRKAGLLSVHPGSRKFWRKVTSMGTWGTLALVGVGCWRLKGGWVSGGLKRRIDEVYRVAFGLVGI